MVENGVCAVVVTFRPPPVVPANLARARPQVQGLVVVDNGSSAEALAPIVAASRELGFQADREWRQLRDRCRAEHRRQVGQIAGIQAGSPLFDQDSTLSDGFIATMLREYETNPLREKIAIVTPKHLELETGEWDRPPLPKMEVRWSRSPPAA